MKPQKHSQSYACGINGTLSGGGTSGRRIPLCPPPPVPTSTPPRTEPAGVVRPNPIQVQAGELPRTGVQIFGAAKNDRCSLGAAPTRLGDVGARTLTGSVVRPRDDLRALPQRSAADLLHRRRRLPTRDVPAERRGRQLGTGLLLDQVDDLVGGQSMWVSLNAAQLGV